jgi:predicted TPR repeat methyltransferase
LARPKRFQSLLDLGRGTGLAGALFRPFVTQLVGVDLSAAEIARAEAKGYYNRLVVGNLAAFLTNEIANQTKYDLVVAADVFVYLNDLAPVLAAIARALAPRGIVTFTVETHSGAGVALLPTLRFAHADGYLRDAIAGAGLKLITLGKPPSAPKKWCRLLALWSSPLPAVPVRVRHPEVRVKRASKDERP